MLTAVVSRLEPGSTKYFRKYRVAHDRESFVVVDHMACPFIDHSDLGRGHLGSLSAKQFSGESMPRYDLKLVDCCFDVLHVGEFQSCD